ncbi:MAG TPA: PIN domain-containing protein [Candidatus Kapabacteria bacterium]|nr:PIN domain-containing protein [Candidatus Kapabacteria bacterium]
MSSYQIIDAGPLIALLNPKDSYHSWAKEQFSNTTAALLTCEAVIAEAAHNLSRSHYNGLKLLIEFANAAPIQIPFSYSQNREEILELVVRYSDVPMSFADACLVRISELYPDAPILTLDADFLIYRRNKNERLPVILPEERSR